jgi:hypothetical protein
LGGLALGGAAAAAAIALGRRGTSSEDAGSAPGSHVADATTGETAGDPVTTD